MATSCSGPTWMPFSIMGPPALAESEGERRASGFGQSDRGAVHENAPDAELTG